MQHAGGVGIGARAGVVLRVGNDHRLVAAIGQRQGALHRIGRAQQVQRPVAAQLHHLVRDALHCLVHGLRHRDRGRRPPARIRRSRPPGSPSRSSGARRCARPARLNRSYTPRAGSIIVHCAFSGSRKGRRTWCVAQGRPCCPQLGQQIGATRAGVGAVDVRVGAVGAHRAGMLQHAPRDVGMQVQAGDQRHRRPDHCAQPLQQLAFGIVHVLGHCRAVQVEVDASKPPLRASATM